MGDPRTTRELLDELERWRIRAARGTGKARLSLRDVSALTGVPHNSLSNYLSGATQMPVDVLDAVVLALGATPDEAREWAQAWESALAAGQRAAATEKSAVPRQLPAPVTAFTGRRSFFKRLGQILESGDRTVVISAIAGTAGVGKTALAVHWAHSVADRFTDGQLYVNLRGYGPGEPASCEAVLERFLKALGQSQVPADPDERAALFRSTIADRRVLIVLDNARTTEQVRPLLPGSPGCVVVVTSRSRLPGLVVHDGAQRLDLARLDSDEALDLLAALLGPEPVRLEPEAAAELVRLCAGLPLTLRIAVERVSSLRGATGPSDARGTPLAAAVAELRDEAGRLDVFGSEEDPLIDVRTVFSWSYRALHVSAARLFRFLGLIPGPEFDVYAAANLADTDLPEARRDLAALAEASLIEPVGNGRYGIHDLLRVYAGELAEHEPAQQRRSAVTRYLDWYLHTANAAMDLVGPRRRRLPAAADVPKVTGPAFTGTQTARVWLEEERPGLLAATRHAATSGWPHHGWRFPQTLWRFYYMAGHTADWAEGNQQGSAAAAAAGDVLGQAEILQSRAVAESVVANRYNDSAELLREALALRRSIDDRYGEATTLGALGSAYHLMGRMSGAVEFYNRALTGYREAGDRHGEGFVLNNLALLAQDVGRHREADDHYASALHVCREIEDGLGTATALTRLGSNKKQRGDYADALVILHEAVAITEQLGAAMHLCDALTNLAAVYTALGDFDRSEDCCRRVRMIAHDNADQEAESRAIAALGENYLKRGDAAAALEYFEQSLASCAGDPGPRRYTFLQNALGDAWLALGDLETSRTHFQTVLDVRGETFPVNKGHAEWGMARVLLARTPPDRAAARRHLERALRIFSDIEGPEIQAVQAMLGQMT